MNRRLSLRSEHGQATAELALVLPILCVLLFGIVQFAIVFNRYLTLTDAVRVGARQAAVSRFVANPVAATTAKVQAAAEGMAPPELQVTVTKPNGTPAVFTTGSDVKVTATYPYAINVLGWVVADGTLSSSTVERVE